MEQPDPRTHEYASKAANPNSMGGFGQPDGRPEGRTQPIDKNHPKATAGAKLGAPVKQQPGTPGF